MHLFFPLASSILYVVAALFLKQSASRGVDIWRTAFVCNAMTALLFLCLWPLGGKPVVIELLWQPLLVALLFIVAQLMTFLALKTGDVSVATPVMGSKVVLVAVFTTLLGAGTVPLALWAAALLSTLGIASLNGKGETRHANVLRTVWLSLAAVSAYALFDVLVMSWAPNWGTGRFLPLVMLASGLLSFGFLPLARKGKASRAWRDQRPLFFGAVFMSLQALILVSSMAIYGDATAINVIYSTRGLWSVLAVWWLGHLFGNTERSQGGGVFRSRLFGAACLCASVALVFV
ncbi:EamA/RhaT family transporter [Haloferula chungangensis]|uniref:EamA/RhaT family transporter n=1 Tax=Haloferula chungangensis TaxID=1048331 RepID=A0ABW2L7R1_9BACT